MTNITALKFQSIKNNIIYVATGNSFKDCFDKANRIAKDNERINIASYYGEHNCSAYLIFLEKTDVILEP